MSYDIYIGEATPCYATEESPYFDWDVPSITRTDAPTFPNDSMTGNGNSRHPAYIGWSDFCKKTGLYDLFFDKSDGLMRQHPGIQPLTTEHLKMVQDALCAFQKRYPDATPRFDGFSFGAKEDLIPEATDEDGCIARLIWLEWWMRYAIENCEHPAIENH